MIDFGIGETIAATSAAEGAKGAGEAAGAAGAKGAGEAAAGAGAAEAGADLLAPAAGAALGGDVAAGAAGLTAEGLPFTTLGAGEALAAGVPEVIIPGVSAAAEGTGAGLAAGLGGVGSAIGSALIPSASAAEGGVGAAGGLGVSPNSVMGGEFGPFSDGSGTTGLQSLPAPGATPPSATGAATAAAPSGVTPAVGADPTAVAAGAPQSLDALAAGGTPSGGVSGAGLTPNVAAGAPAAANVGGAAATAAPTASSPFSLESLVGSVGKSVAANPLGLGLAGGGLIYSVLSEKQVGEAQQKLAQEAAALGPQGQQLMSYLSSGSLPPGLKLQLDQATKAAKASVISNYAKQGLSTDPTQNSALAQQLQMIDQQAVISVSQIGEQLYTTGLQTAGLSSQLYTQLAQLDQTQTANIGKAIANFAGAISPSKGLTLNVGGSKAA